MISITKLALGCLSRAILARAVRTSNTVKKGSAESKAAVENHNAAPNRRTTVTVETERLLIVSHRQSWSEIYRSDAAEEM